MSRVQSGLHSQLIRKYTAVFEIACYLDAICILIFYQIETQYTIFMLWTCYIKYTIHLKYMPVPMHAIINLAGGLYSVYVCYKMPDRLPFPVTGTNSRFQPPLQSGDSMPWMDLSCHDTLCSSSSSSTLHDFTLTSTSTINVMRIWRVW